MLERTYSIWKYQPKESPRLREKLTTVLTEDLAILRAVRIAKEHPDQSWAVVEETMNRKDAGRHKILDVFAASRSTHRVTIK